MIVAVSHRFQETSLSGRGDEYVSLADALARGDGVVALDAGANVDPYDYALSAIEVRRDESREGVLMSIDGAARKLVLDGPLVSLRILANVVRDSSGIEGFSEGHVHVEYFPGHFYLAEGSVPLIISDARER